MDSPVPIIPNACSLRGLQVFREDLKCFHERFLVGDKVRGTVEVREHPFVRIEDERIDQFYSIDHPAHFREKEGCSGVGRIDVEPQVVFPADLCDGAKGIDGGGTGRADGSDHAEGRAAFLEIRCDCALERIHVHGIRRIHRYCAKGTLPEARDLHPLFNR